MRHKAAVLDFLFQLSHVEFESLHPVGGLVIHMNHIILFLSIRIRKWLRFVIDFFIDMNHWFGVILMQVFV